MEFGPALRVLRGALLASVVLAVSVGAHMAAGGHRAPVGLVVLAGLALTSAFAAALGRPASWRRVAALQLVGQAALHGLMALAHPGHAGAASLSANQAPAHLHSGSLAGLAGPAPAAGSLGEALAAGGVAMLLLHLAATAVLTVWLVAGERAVVRLIAGAVEAGCEACAAAWSRTLALAARVAQCSWAVPAAGPPTRPQGGWSPLRGAAEALRAAPRRGPPAYAAA